MSQISNTRKAVLLTVALGLSALASTTMAAAGPFSSKPSHITPADFPHPHVSTNVGKPVNLPAKLDGADKLPPYVSKTIGNQKLKVPLGNDNNPRLDRASAVPGAPGDRRGPDLRTASGGCRSDRDGARRQHGRGPGTAALQLPDQAVSQ